MELILKWFFQRKKWSGKGTMERGMATVRSVPVTRWDEMQSSDGVNRRADIRRCKCEFQTASVINLHNDMFYGWIGATLHNVYITLNASCECNFIYSCGLMGVVWLVLFAATLLASLAVDIRVRFNQTVLQTSGSFRFCFSFKYFSGSISFSNIKYLWSVSTAG